MAKSISILKSPDDFFNTLIDEALKVQKLSISDTLRFYLLSLLSGNLLNSSNQYSDTPFAILVQQAQLAPVEQKREILKFVGDKSLYTAGYFSQSLNKKLINRDYYVNMGKIAFSSLSAVATSKELELLYWSLFKHFNDMVTILLEVSAKTFAHNLDDIVRLYEMWQNTKSKIIEQILIDKGFVNDQNNKKN